jgi:hypothetical protein
VKPQTMLNTIRRGKKIGHLFGETSREIGLLLLTFCILDALFVDKATLMRVKENIILVLRLGIGSVLLGMLLQFLCDPNELWPFLVEKQKAPTD